MEEVEGRNPNLEKKIITGLKKPLIGIMIFTFFRRPPSSKITHFATCLLYHSCQVSNSVSPSIRYIHPFRCIPWHIRSSSFVYSQSKVDSTSSPNRPPEKELAVVDLLQAIILQSRGWYGRATGRKFTFFLHIESFMRE